MANTNQLKYIIEQELKRNFCDKNDCELITLSNKELQHIFNDMEPDLVAIDKNSGTLHIGEITTSGFMGHRDKDYHIGAGKKVFEAFSKFYLLLMDKGAVIQRLSKYHDFEAINNIKCHFIVPEGARFIKALGYKAKLFKTGIMSLDTIKLTNDSEQLMIQILIRAKEEMGQSKTL